MKSISKNVVVVGGGTGSFVVLSGLKQYSISLDAIISVADSGGSTGRLRDEFGFLPVGDLRQALAALTSKSSQDWIKKVLLYRFSKGSGLEGHNLGNLILTALQDMTGSTAKTMEIVRDIFQLQGNIYPVTSKNIQLVVEYQDGQIVIGEHLLDEQKYGGKKIVSLKTSPRASINPQAQKSILNADTIVFCPGDMYASIIPHCVIQGFSQAIAQSTAPIIYIVNLMSRYAQTHNMSASDHVQVLESYLGKSVNHIIVNNAKLPASELKRYATHNEFPVIDDLKSDSRVIRSPLLKSTPVLLHEKDSVPRSYLRHDTVKLAKVLISLISSPSESK